MPYPCNIADNFEMVRTQLAQVLPVWTPYIVADEHHAAQLVLEARFNTGWEVYYLPIKGVHTMLRSNRRASQTRLLGGILAYLRQVIRLESYCDDHSYFAYDLDRQIESTLDGWDEDNEADDEELAALTEAQQLRELRKRRKSEASRLMRRNRREQRRGKTVERYINQPGRLADLPQLARSYSPRSSRGNHLKTLATQVVDLVKSHPNQSLMDCFVGVMPDEEADTLIVPEQYIALIWDLEAESTQFVTDGLDTELNAGAVLVEPRLVQYFNTPQQPLTPFAFEEKLFSLLRNLKQFLHDLTLTP